MIYSALWLFGSQPVQNSADGIPTKDIVPRSGPVSASASRPAPETIHIDKFTVSRDTMAWVLDNMPSKAYETGPGVVYYNGATCYSNQQGDWDCEWVYSK